jgi:3-deoxy-D-manno-octulosonic-acid transferase
MAGRDHDVIVLDTMGELEMAYAAADLAFVGATLVNIGGHNPLEPAMYGVPVVVGPHHSVIREIVGEMRARGGICEVASEEDVYALLKRLCSNEERIREIGHAGRCVWEHHRGSSGRVYAVLSESEEYRCHSF